MQKTWTFKLIDDRILRWIEGLSTPKLTKYFDNEPYFMTDASAETSDELVRAKINSETARIPWKELQRFFASGKTLLVDSGLDLVEVGFSFHEDQAERVAQWLEQKKIRVVSTELAKQWVENNAEVWAVVVKPWVLIQDTELSAGYAPTKLK